MFKVAATPIITNSEMIPIWLFIAGVLVAICGYLFRRNENQHATTQKALATQSEALTKMLARGEAFTLYPEKVNRLESAVAGMKSDIKALKESHNEDIARLWEDRYQFESRKSHE